MNYRPASLTSGCGKLLEHICQCVERYSSQMKDQFDLCLQRSTKEQLLFHMVRQSLARVCGSMRREWLGLLFVHNVEFIVSPYLILQKYLIWSVMSF